MIKKYPLMFRFLLLVFLPILGLGLFLLFHFASSITPTRGNLELTGLNHPVKISLDQYGTPTIVAETDHDAYFALGFKHASDRLWQLELQRRLAQGRLSEILGAEALGEDIWMRTLGLHEAAKQSIPYLQKDTLAALNAYSEGINAWIAQASSLPPEFQALGIRPEPWTIYDSLSWQKVFSLTLSGNMFDEVRRTSLLHNLSPEEMKYFYPYDPINIIATASRSAQNNLIATSDSLLDFGIGHPFTGSNAWVVAGKYTQSGHPIIANDPHVGLQLPALWYAAALKGDKLNSSGMTLVGLPMIIFGQNADIAWGGTSLESDQEDLFIETISPQHPNQYRHGDEWKNFDSHTEIIHINPDFPALLHDRLNPVEVTVRKTERGPVISDARSMMDEVISLRWAALDAEDHTSDAFVQIQYAKNWSEFRNALSQLKSPGLSFVYADRTGNIGYQVAGMLPKRGQGVGILPLVASSENNWQGYYDFNLLPSILNPEQGFLVSANEQVKHSPEIVISHEWAPKARHERITDLLQQNINTGKLLTINDMEVIQSDRTDLTALAVLPFLKNVKGESEQEKAAIAELQKWDGAFTADSVAATLFATWSYYLKHEILDSVLHSGWERPGKENLLASSIERMDWYRLADVLATDNHGWCKKNQATPCTLELQKSLANTLKQLDKISGTHTLSKWNWSSISRTEFVHQPFGRVKGLEGLFKRTVHSVSSPNSINAANIQFDSLKGFKQDFGASFRQIFELDADKSHWYMVSTGQSGNIVSPHFDDMIAPFVINQLAPFIAHEQTKDVINLIPALGQHQ